MWASSSRQMHLNQLVLGSALVSLQVLPVVCGGGGREKGVLRLQPRRVCERFNHTALCPPCKPSQINAPANGRAHP